MHSVLDVARYIIYYCQRRGYAISNLKLQKILYFIQANFLVTLNRACFREAIEAWDFGPVVPEAYHKYKFYGSSSIREDVNVSCTEEFTNEEITALNEIIDECARYSASALVDLTHHQEPWTKAYKPFCNNIISHNAIRDYFSE